MALKVERLHGLRVQTWRQTKDEPIAWLLQDISMQSADLAPVSVALRELRHLA